MEKRVGLLIMLAAVIGDLAFNIPMPWSPVVNTNSPYLDIILHFLGGLGVTLVLYGIVSKDFDSAPPYQLAILVIGATMLVGVLWEFAEFTGTAVFHSLGKNIELAGDAADTLSDLFMDLIGATTASVLHFFRHRKAQNMEGIS